MLRAAKLESNDIKWLNAVVGLDRYTIDEDIATLQSLLDATTGRTHHT